MTPCIELFHLRPHQIYCMVALVTLRHCCIDAPIAPDRNLLLIFGCRNQDSVALMCFVSIFKCRCCFVLLHLNLAEVFVTCTMISAGCMFSADLYLLFRLFFGCENLLGVLFMMIASNPLTAEYLFSKNLP